MTISLVEPPQPSKPSAEETLLERVAHPPVLRTWLTQLDECIAMRPDDKNLLLKRADLLRALGEIDAAAAEYRAALEGAETSRITTILSGSVPGWTDPAGPAPFLRLMEVLTAAQQEQLWSVVEAGQKTLDAASVGDGAGRVDPTLRQAASLKRTDALSRWFLPRIEEVIVSSGGLPRLGLGAIPTGERELQLTSHGHGGFFRMHQDSGDGAMRTRDLTYVYYFHREPIRFAGGDLLLFDQTAAGARAGIIAFTRLAPQHNTLVLFRADRQHAVTRVVCDSPNPLDGRWTANGWFHRLPDTA